MKSKTSLFSKGEMKSFNSFNPIFTQEQMDLISRPTPKEMIEINDEGFKSVKSDYAKAFLTLVTGGNYNFEILSHEYNKSMHETIVHSRLTIYSVGNISRPYFREQFGRHYLNTNEEKYPNGKSFIKPVDFGNGYKSAASDALKKCMSEFGFFWDVYTSESIEVKKPPVKKLSHEEKVILERLDKFMSKANNEDEVKALYDKSVEPGHDTEESKSILEKHLNRVMSSED